MIYSFLDTICKKHEVNPYQWLKYALENIMVIKGSFSAAKDKGLPFTDLVAASKLE